MHAGAVLTTLRPMIRELPEACLRGSDPPAGLNSNKHLQNAAWKERLASMEAMLEHVKGLDSVSPEAASMLIQGVAYLPGWSEKNFQVCFQSTHSARGDCNI